MTQKQPIFTPPFSGITVVDSFNGLCDPGEMKNGEVARVFPASLDLRADFGAAGRRIATTVRDLANVLETTPVIDRTGRVLVRADHITSNWRLLTAKYNPFGSMSKNERIAFDILFADFKMIENDCDDVGLVLSIVYDDKVYDDFDINKFHTDFGDTIARCYNQGSTYYADYNDVVPDEHPNGDMAYTLKPGAVEHSFGLGNYWLYKGSHHAGDQPPGGLIHRAPPKQKSNDPRLIMNVILD